jgi:polyisoprenyl-teichoic acid--peptidoglycan teichoic acid transferase
VDLPPEGVGGSRDHGSPPDADQPDPSEPSPSPDLVLDETQRIALSHEGEPLNDEDDPEAFDALTPPKPAPRRSRYPAAILDALIPGLGHLVAGRRVRALLFVSPLLVMLATGAWIVATTSGPRLAATLLSADVIWGLLAAQGLLLASRLIAVGSSLFDPALPRPDRRDLAPIALLLAFVIAPQAYAGYATEIAREAADRIFVEPVAVAAPSSTPRPDPSVLATARPSASPSPSVNPTGERITGLLIGVDAGIGRNTYLTDTMIVVSLDLGTRTVSMLSIPRDMVDVPLPDGRTFRDKVNSLVSYARRNTAAFPGSDGTGFDVLMNALSTLLNVPIDYYATVNLGGFVRVVDTLGGVDVNVARAFCDPTYDEYGFTRGFSIKAGLHHLNGQQALAYARVRKASGESDFTRAARQQEVISGIRDAIVGGGFLNDPIGLLEAIGQTVQTNVPRELLPDLAELAGSVGRAQTYRTVVNHPLVASGFDVRGSIQIPDIDAIRALAAALFPIDGSLPDEDYALVKPAPAASPGTSPAATVTPTPATPAGSGVGGCAPAPRPSATPTPRPTEAPSATPAPSTEPSPSGDPNASPTPSGSPAPSTPPSPVVPPVEPSPSL